MPTIQFIDGKWWIRGGKKTRGPYESQCAAMAALRLRK